MKHAVSKALYSLSGFFWQLPFILWVAHWFWRWPNSLPVPGYAVAILGVAAVVMAVRANAFTRIEERVWIILAAALCFVEIQAIRQDREIASKAQTDLIGGIVDTVKTQTGGDSFAFITLTGPEPPILTFSGFSHPSGPWMLVSITSHGKYPLRDIHATLMDDARRQAAVQEYNAHPDGNWMKAINSAYTVYQYPYLRPQSAEAPSGDVEPIGAYPIPEGTDKRLTIAFSSLNGYWNEVLHQGLVGGQWRQCLSVLGPTLKQSTDPFIWCDSDWPQGKALAEKDWASLTQPAQR
jgi:hypothetical protein